VAALRQGKGEKRRGINGKTTTATTKGMIKYRAKFAGLAGDTPWALGDLAAEPDLDRAMLKVINVPMRANR
jgi:hypothetical protein